MIAIVDFGGGNIQSVKNALDRLGAVSIVTDDPETIAAADKVIFPGQGHFGACIQSLWEKGLFDAVRNAALTKPFLGICVGMQLLFERSEEAPGVAGLGVLKGEVRKFCGGQKLPQMGWNQANGKDPYTGQFYYFANSYCCFPEDGDCIAATTEYGEIFVSAIAQGSLTAVQFHPEKSGAEGMKILERFLS